MRHYPFHCRLKEGGKPCPGCVDCGKAQLNGPAKHKVLMALCDKVLNESGTCSKCGPNCPYSATNVANNLDPLFKPLENTVKYSLWGCYYIFCIVFLGLFFIGLVVILHHAFK